MRRAPLPALIVCALVLLGGGRASAQTYDTVNVALVDAVVIPAYEAYAAAITRLPPAIEAVCAGPAPASVDAAQQAWREAMLAWQRAQPIRLGPVVDEGLGPQIEFWPDKHGTAGRQLSSALASRDASLLDADALSGKSVGLTSLATLERLLFGEDLLDPDGRAYACAFAQAVARYQVDLADHIVAGWQGPDGFRATVASAADGNEVFFSAFDPSVLLIRSIADSLDDVIQVKLEPPLGQSLAAARGRRAENWRSGLELPSVVANLETARDLYVTPGGFADLYLALGGQPSADEEIRERFEGAIAAAAAIPLPLADAVGDPGARVQVEALIDQLKVLRVAIRGPLAVKLGLPIGFNATDGD